MIFQRMRMAIVVLVLTLTGPAIKANENESRVRRPVALAFSENGQWLYTANRASGSISMIDTSTQTVANEFDLGGQLADLVAIDDTHLLVLDEQRHQLVLLVGSAESWAIAARLKVAEYPVQICLDAESRRCFVTSLWSRAVTEVDLAGIFQTEAPSLAIKNEIRLAFEPREICLIRDKKSLVVAGSFTNELALLEAGSLELIAQKQLPGHNIRGMALSQDGSRLLIAHQRLNSLARSTRDDVHWGNMVANVLVSLSLNKICRTDTKLLEPQDVQFLGEPGNAAGDPGSIEIGPRGELMMALSGVNELAIENEQLAGGFKRIRVGSGPTALAASQGGIVCVANKYSDSVSIVDRTQNDHVNVVSLGVQPNLSLAEQGEILFFDSRLSHDGWMSCHSCHTDGHSNGQLNDNLSDGSFSAPKRVLSLLGVSETGPWAWNGEVDSLDEQVRNSIQVTMQGSEPSDEQVAAIVAYLETLPAPPTGEREPSRSGNRNIAQGRKLFQSLECQQCHVAPTYTSPRAYDVGLADVAGNRKFNPPSLRGVGARAALFHDASARSLRDVLVSNKHQLGRSLTAEEIDSLVAFLQSI